MSRPFHHGNLRAALLDEAEVMLRESGIDGLSLRELARRAGVSHGAPRSHFIDRQALLDALAVEGFQRLTALTADALAGAGDVADKVRSVGHAYVDFALDDAALMELMFARKVGQSAESVEAAAVGLFAVLDGALDEVHAEAHARTRFKLLFAAAMQGAATLVAAGRVGRAEADVIVDDAVDALLSSPLAGRVLPRRPRERADASDGSARAPGAPSPAHH